MTDASPAAPHSPAISAAAAFPLPPSRQSGRPITLMHGFTPGANVDITARIIAEGWQAARPAVVVETRLGAGGTVSAAAVARAAPDGTPSRSCPAGIRLPQRSTSSFLQRGRRLHLHQHADRKSVHPGDLSGSSREDRRGHDQVGAGRSRQADLRDCRQRHRHASRIRAFPAMAKVKIQQCPIAGRRRRSPI